MTCVFCILVPTGQGGRAPLIVVVTETFGRTVWNSNQSVTRHLTRTDQQKLDIHLRPPPIGNRTYNPNFRTYITCVNGHFIYALIHLCCYSPSVSPASSLFAMKYLVSAIRYIRHVQTDNFIVCLSTAALSHRTHTDVVPRDAIKRRRTGYAVGFLCRGKTDSSEQGPFYQRVLYLYANLRKLNWQKE